MTPGFALVPTSGHYTPQQKHYWPLNAHTPHTVVSAFFAQHSVCEVHYYCCMYFIHSYCVLECRFYYHSGMVSTADPAMPTIEKIVCSNSQELGVCSSHHTGLRGEAPGWVSPQREQEKELLLWFLQERIGEAEEAGSGLGSLNWHNVSGLWGVCCLTMDWGQRNSSSEWKSSIKQVVGGGAAGSGLLSLHTKGTTAGESFTVPGNWLAPEEQSLQGLARP